jgi:hypothetical protein
VLKFLKYFITPAQLYCKSSLGEIGGQVKGFIAVGFHSSGQKAVDVMPVRSIIA